MQVPPHPPSPRAQLGPWSMRVTASPSAPKPTQSSPSVLGREVSLPRLLDENEDENEDEQLCWVITLVKTAPL